jgi:hypothetical protein
MVCETGPLIQLSEASAGVLTAAGTAIDELTSE